VTVSISALTDWLHAACPSNKYLQFVYPEPVTEERLFELPVSVHGIAAVA